MMKLQIKQVNQEKLSAEKLQSLNKAEESNISVLTKMGIGKLLKNEFYTK